MNAAEAKRKSEFNTIRIKEESEQRLQEQKRLRMETAVDRLPTHMVAVMNQISDAVNKGEFSVRLKLQRNTYGGMLPYHFELVDLIKVELLAKGYKIMNDLTVSWN